MRYRTGPRRPTPRSSASRCCALGQLSPRDRAIIVLRYWEDHSVQTVAELRVDCDQDAVLLKVDVGGDGGACHTGRRSCFYRTVEDGKLVLRD